VDIAELAAREGIRDLVARYNLLGDAGRTDAVADLFTVAGVLVVGDRVATRTAAGRAEIASFLSSIRDDWAAESDAGGHERYVRHGVTTHVIDLSGPERATGRCYVSVIRGSGLASWGRYFDEYELVGGSWLFASRKALADTPSGARSAVTRGA
jgi:hypothetical protein